MAASVTCPKGDQSDDAEFCSVCGIKIEGVASTVATDPSVERCPSCGIERKAGARFCETCRYDFKSQPSASPAPSSAVPELNPVPPPVVGVTNATPVAPTPSAQTSSAAPTSATPTAGAPTSSPSAQVETGPHQVAAPVVATPGATAAVRYWEALVSVDPSLDVEPDPATPCPADAPERAFPLDLPENLIGRRSTARGILPSITLNDPGVSHRHMMVYRNSDASLSISDLGSSNGTFLNGSDQRLEPGVKTGLADGDQVELGRWTRITFRSRD
jgi:hypothetical protein